MSEEELQPEELSTEESLEEELSTDTPDKSTPGPDNLERLQETRECTTSEESSDTNSTEVDTDGTLDTLELPTERSTTGPESSRRPQLRLLPSNGESMSGDKELSSADNTGDQDLSEESERELSEDLEDLLSELESSEEELLESTLTESSDTRLRFLRLQRLKERLSEERSSDAESSEAEEDSSEDTEEDAFSESEDTKELSRRLQLKRLFSPRRSTTSEEES